MLKFSQKNSVGAYKIGASKQRLCIHLYSFLGSFFIFILFLLLIFFIFPPFYAFAEMVMNVLKLILKRAYFTMMHFVKIVSIDKLMFN